MNERMRSAVFAAALAVIGVVALSERAEANWRWTEAGCTWDANTEGPDECDPNLPVGEPPEVTPETTPEFQGQLSNPGGIGTNAVAPPSCRAYTKRGNAGYISVQVNPMDGSLAWGAYMNNALDNYGLWAAGVYVNGSLVDSKYQVYPPHASLPYSKAPGGSNVFISVQHLYFSWAIVPVFIPEFGWTFRATWVPGIAYGTLSCLAPFRGL